MSRPETTSEGSQDRLDSLVIECLERLELEGLQGLEGFLGEHPDESSRIRERIRKLEKIGLLSAPKGEGNLPEFLGPFRLLEVLGRGGMGVVYRAEQPSLNRQVAVKVMSPELFHVPHAKERFRREVMAAASVDHPGIVAVHAVGEEDGAPYYAMELVDGCDLATALKEMGALDRSRWSGAELARTVGAADAQACEGVFRRSSWVDLCFEICAQVAAALEQAHRKGILHRDLKPANIMITRDGRVRLLDFGLASTQASVTVTATASLVGSLPYMAPEQLRANPRVDARTDVYQLGVTLYELLTLRSPYLCESREETHRRILAGVPPPLKSGAPGIAWDAETVCLTSMDVEPRRRYQSIQDFRSDLLNFLARRSIKAKRPSSWLRARRWAERHPAWSVALAAFVLLAVGSTGHAVKLSATNAMLRRSNGEKEQALQEAVAAQAEANHNFRVALDTATRLLKDVGFHQLRDVPGMEATRSALLDKAVIAYREMIAMRPKDGGARHLLAEACLGNANVLLELNRLEQARSVIVEGIELLEALCREYPANRKYQSSLGTCCDQLGQVLDAMGRLDESIEVTERSVQIMREVVEEVGRESPRDSLHQRQMLAGIMHNLARKLAPTDRTEEAIELFEQAREHIQIVLEAKPTPDGRYTLVGVLANLSGATWTVGDVSRAQELAREAVRRGSELVQEFPRDRGYRHMHAFALMRLMLVLDEDEEVLEAGRRAEEAYRKLVRDHGGAIDRFQLAVTLQGIGDALRRSGRLDEARAIHREALSIVESLTGFHGAALRAKQLRLRICLVAGDLELAAGRETEAEQAYRDAIAIVDEIQEREPGFRDEDSFVAVPLTSLAELERRQGQWQEARALAERAVATATRHASPTPRSLSVQAECRLVLAQIAVEQGDHRAGMKACEEIAAKAATWDRNRSAAALAVRCLALVDEEMLPPPEHRALHEAYEQRALQLLRAALERGECDRQTIANDDAWHELRDLDEFRALVDGS